jgi:hypothetical protein
VLQVFTQGIYLFQYGDVGNNPFKADSEFLDGAVDGELRTVADAFYLGCFAELI